jgi:hypothetical protein
MSMFLKMFVKKNTANYYNNEKKELLRLVDQNIDTFQNIMASRNTKNIKTITRKYNQASNINKEILSRILKLRVEFKKTIIALPVVKTLPNSAKPYVKVSNNRYRFTNFPKVFQMSKILTNLSVEKAMNAAAAKKIKNNATAAKAVTNAAAAKAVTNAATAKAVTNANAKKISNTASIQVITNAANVQLKKSKMLKTELNNAAVTNTVIQQLGTSGENVPITQNILRSRMQKFINNRGEVTIN